MSKSLPLGLFSEKGEGLGFSPLLQGTADSVGDSGEHQGRGGWWAPVLGTHRGGTKVLWE